MPLPAEIVTPETTPIEELKGDPAQDVDSVEFSAELSEAQVPSSNAVDNGEVNAN